MPCYVLRNQHVSSAIMGASRPEQIWQCVRALGVVEKLGKDLLAEIDEVMGNKPEEGVMRY